MQELHLSTSDGQQRSTSVQRHGNSKESARQRGHLKWAAVVLCDDCLVCTDGQAGGRLKEIIPEHSAGSLLQLLNE